MDKYQKLMVELGVSDSTLRRMIDTLKTSPNIQGAKISGSGLGDCILTLGEVTQHYIGEHIKITMATEGVL
jgi:mevalonate kinase